MPRISCSVSSCAYNQGRICGANTLNIAGRTARVTESTCCSTYMKQSGYSNWVSSETNLNETQAIFCEVGTCAYHQGNYCTLNEIEVGSLKDVENYIETDCLSFERK